MTIVNVARSFSRARVSNTTLPSSNKAAPHRCFGPPISTAPEAYVLAAAIEGWTRKETDEQIRLRAAEAYHKYQHCGLKAAPGFFATGW